MWNIFVFESKVLAALALIAQKLDTLIKLLTPPPDVASLKVKVDKPINQTGEKDMSAPNVHGFRIAAANTTMLDDQKALMHIQPLDDTGAPIALPPGQPVPVYTTSDPSVTLDPSQDPTGLSCWVLGVHGTAGTPTVTATYTNADGSVATGTAPFTITVDPKELDVADLGVTVDSPVSQ